MSGEEQRRIFSKNLNRLLTIKDKTQKEAADAIGVSPQTFNTWCQGIALPRMDKIQLLATYFHVAKTELLDEQIENKDALAESVKIPVLGEVPAGVPIEALQEIIDYEEIPSSMARTGEYYGLRIKGRSMEPRIFEGDVVIIRKQEDVENGSIAIVLVNGQEGTCKKVLKNDNGLTLVSYNPQYDPIFFSWKDVHDLPVKILGLAVEVRGKLI